MAAKKFYPKPAAMTKRQIAQWMNDEIFVANDIINDLDGEEDPRDLEYVEEQRPIAAVGKVEPKRITDKLAQEFVDRMYLVLDESVDMREEDMVDVRVRVLRELILQY